MRDISDFPVWLLVSVGVNNMRITKTMRIKGQHIGRPWAVKNKYPQGCLGFTYLPFYSRKFPTLVNTVDTIRYATFTPEGRFLHNVAGAGATDRDWDQLANDAVRQPTLVESRHFQARVLPGCLELPALE
ncbi:hypothetical protein K456DRAFT_718775 [Colletotrichum gloeosporioides 23]|nr:hypothetical protein K456DRAFT_718775 [Colletotrichum gloeosporioides 23]